MQRSVYSSQTETSRRESENSFILDSSALVMCGIESSSAFVMLRSETTMSASLTPSIESDLKKVRLESKKLWSSISFVMFMQTRLYLGTGSNERRNFW